MAKEQVEFLFYVEDGTVDAICQDCYQKNPPSMVLPWGQKLDYEIKCNRCGKVLNAETKKD